MNKYISGLSTKKSGFHPKQKELNKTKNKGKKEDGIKLEQWDHGSAISDALVCGLIEWYYLLGLFLMKYFELYNYSVTL